MVFGYLMVRIEVGEGDSYERFATQLNMVFFMVLSLTPRIKLLILMCKNGSFTIEWE